MNESILDVRRRNKKKNEMCLKKWNKLKPVDETNLGKE